MTPAFGKWLSWTCMALVALPLSPCAFFTSSCCQSAETSTERSAAAPAAARPCCAHHAPSEAPAPAERPERPCNSECCRVSPFVSLGEKSLAALPLDALVAVLPAVDQLSWSTIAPPTTVVPQPLSLNVLHCCWRC